MHRMTKANHPTPRVTGPWATPQASKPSRGRAWSKRVNRTLAVGAFVACLAFTVFAATGTNQSATAATNALAPTIGACSFLPEGNTNWDPESPGSGTEGLLTPTYGIGSGPNDAKTPLEKYGLRGLNYSITTVPADPEGDGVCSIMPEVQNMLADETANLGQTIASVTIAVRQKATDASPFLGMIRGLQPSTGWLAAGAVTMVMLTGVWMLTKGVGGKNREIVSGVVWVVIAITGVTWLLLPTRLTNTGIVSDACSTESGRNDPDCYSTSTPSGQTPINRNDPNYYALTAKANDLGGGVASTLTRVLAPEGSLDVCRVSRGVPDEGPRTLDCVLWSEMAFKPWAQGQFGGIGTRPIPWKAPEYDDARDGWEKGTKGAQKKSTAYARAEKPKTGDDVRLLMLYSQAFSYQEARETGMPFGALGGTVASDEGPLAPNTEYTGSPDRVSEDSDSDEQDRYDATTKNGVWNQVRIYMGENQPTTYGAWAGQANTGSRVNTSMMTLFGNSLIAVFVISTSLLTLMWYAVVVLALLALPVVGTLSIYPPAQKFLRALGQLWVKGLILAVVFTFVQTMTVSLAGTILASNAAYGWKCLLLLAAVMGMFKIVKMAREDAFTPNLNSQGAAENLDPQNTVNRMSPMAATAGYMVARVGRGTAGRVAGGLGYGKAGGAKASTKVATDRSGKPGVGTGAGVGGEGRVGTGPRVGTGKIGSTIASRVSRTGQAVDDRIADTPVAGRVARRGINQRTDARQEKEQVRQAALVAREEKKGDQVRRDDERAARRGRSTTDSPAETGGAQVRVAADRTGQGERGEQVRRRGSVPERDRGNGPRVTTDRHGSGSGSGGSSERVGSSRAAAAQSSDRGETKQPKVAVPARGQDPQGPRREAPTSGTRRETGESGTRLAPAERARMTRETEAAVTRGVKKADHERKVTAPKTDSDGDGRVR